MDEAGEKAQLPDSVGRETALWEVTPGSLDSFGPRSHYENAFDQVVGYG